MLARNDFNSRQHGTPTQSYYTKPFEDTELGLVSHKLRLISFFG